MPVISFSVSDTVYRVLKRLAEERGLAVTKLAKLVVEDFALHLHGMLNQCLSDRTLNQGLSMPTLNQRLSDGMLNQCLSDRTLNQGLSDLIKNRDTDEAIKNPDTDSEFAKRIESLESKLDTVVRELRKQQDLLNAYTGKADQVLQRVSQLVESQERVVELLQQAVEALKQARASEEVQKASEKPEKQPKKEAKREKPGKCEILRKELALFESEVYGKIRDRDRFFTSLERDCEAIVIECSRERVAVEKGFWSQFLDKLSKIDTNNDDKIKKQLDPLEFKLFKALKESAFLIYSASEKKWRPAISITAKASTTSSTEKHYKKRYEEDESWLLQYAPEPEET